LNLDDYKLERLISNFDVSLFDCDNADLNDFIKNDALKYQDELLSVTYIWLHDNFKIIAFVSLANDKLTKTEIKSLWNKICRPIPNKKRRKTFPSVLIGRLGISSEIHRSGIGSQILTFLKIWFTKNNKTGCRFLLVDAYNQNRAIQFYQKNGFLFLTDEDKDHDTRHMYYDLMRFKPEK
jgi:GNAT superfamily N-acetyltransferase